MNLPGVSGGAAAVRTTASGTPLLVGYVASADPTFDLAAARAALAESLPAALVPRLVLVDELPTRTSGKVDRDALPWPPPGEADEDGARTSAARWAGWPGCGATCSAAPVDGPEADFFALGGGSLSAAQLVAALRAALPAGDRRRSLRPSRGWARWPASSTSSTRRREVETAGRAADTAARRRPPRWRCRCRWPR